MDKEMHIDPRTGIILLLLSNIIAFAQSVLWVNGSWVCILALLMFLCGCGRSAAKFLTAYLLLLILQYKLIPVAPKFIATSFSIFVNYSIMMYPCIIIGILMIRKTPLRHFIVALRKWHLSTNFIISFSVALRYFPAIREEKGHIWDAMKLRNIHGLQRMECMVLPMMVSAINTADELSAAAVTRGIENPAPKTSLVELNMSILDWLYIGMGFIFVFLAIYIK